MPYSNSNDWGALEPKWVNLSGATADDYHYVTDYGSKLTTQNGNNGKKMDGFVKGSTGLSSQFKIGFKLGYQWGWSSLYMANVKAITNNSTASSGNYNVSGYNGMYFINNNSNNDLKVYKSVSGSSSLVIDTTGIADTVIINLWRESDNTVKVRVTGSSAVTVGTFSDDFCFYSVTQSPCSTTLLEAYNISRTIS